MFRYNDFSNVIFNSISVIHIRLVNKHNYISNVFQ